MTDWTREAIDLAMIREFSVHGVQLAGSVSSEQRRERIRVEIWRNKRQVEPFYDSQMTYAEAYAKAYGKSIELRVAPRDLAGRPAMPVDLDEDDDDDLGESQ